MDLRAVGLEAAPVPVRMQPAPAPEAPRMDPESGMEPPGRRQVEQAVDQLNSMAATLIADLQFMLHEGSGRMIVRVVDPGTGNVLREHPPEKVLDTLAAIREVVGLLLDKKI